jgi:hypothetical protein
MGWVLDFYAGVVAGETYPAEVGVQVGVIVDVKEHRVGLFLLAHQRQYILNITIDGNDKLLSSNIS